MQRRAVKYTCNIEGLKIITVFRYDAELLLNTVVEYSLSLVFALTRYY